MKKKINAVDRLYKSLRKVICRESTNCAEDESIDTLDQFNQSLEKVVNDFNLLKKEVMELKERNSIQVHQLPMSSKPAGPVRYPSMRQKVDMVGFDGVLHEVLDQLTGQESSLQIMPITGMGGIGKATLARNAYETKLIMEHFDIRSWVTISQEYNVQKILLEVLSFRKYEERVKSLSQRSQEEIGEEKYRKYRGKVGELSEKSHEEIGEEVHKSLSGRGYLIIIDDMWSIDVWYKVKHFFPNNNNGSRILITTRISNLASQLTNSHIVKLNFLDEDQSWKFLCKNVFGEEDCPVKLKEVGRAIAKNCVGLPLLIAVISGLLVKSPWTQEFWETIAKNLKSVLYSEDDERCIKILRTSYDYLPIHLKPCFLFMGVFPDDHVIRASTLIQLWIAEGFLKPIKGKDLEVVAEEYLTELVDRNLILIDKLGFDCSLKTCRMHDLLRDMCLKEGEKFLSVFGMHNLGVELGNNDQRRVIYHGIKVTRRNLGQVVGAFHLASRARSLIGDFNGIVPQLPFKLLRVLKLARQRKTRWWHSRKIDFHCVNARFLCVDTNWFPRGIFSSSMHLYWNLQTLIINGNRTIAAPREIWKMHQLKHVMVSGLLFLDPPPPEEEFGQWNLQSLSTTIQFKISEEVIKRIPNIKKLKTRYYIFKGKALSDYCISNINHFQNLESFTLEIWKSDGQSGWQLNFNLPHSLKKLKLGGNGIELCWEDVTENLGSLPLLQVLRLNLRSIQGSEWNLVEGKFCNLRLLAIVFCETLEYWVAESIHFPCLEHIQLEIMSKLTEIPSGIGEIGTLQSIRLFACPTSVITSARKIQKEQEEFGNFGLKVEIVS